MHIPDGYLGPKTYITMYGLMVPLWYIASCRVKKRLEGRRIPFLAIGAAFAFVIMMFNLPVPGGTTGHAVGGALIAILIGPWEALIALTTVIVIQALIFGDGGITAIGANCFNMAFAMPFSAYYIYRILNWRNATAGRRALLSAFVAGYLSLNISAILTAFELGIQPLIAIGANGLPLYSPYPLSIAIPAMAFEHLLFFGWVEGLVTALTLSYVRRVEPSLVHNGGIV